ncbi:MAG TPA: hypothetical protein P5076_07440 [Myxococcota bacterium]|nr:hypothetical protein [Myxococcota bacterium]
MRSTERSGGRRARVGLLAATLLGSGWLLAACGGGGGDGQDGGPDGDLPPPCDLLDNPCPAGQRCDQDQACVEAAPLEITTDALPEGRVEFLYRVDLAAAGGLPPYRWELVSADPALDFLSLSSAGRLEGSPAAPVDAGALRVAVVDSGFGGGERVERDFQVTIVTCQEGALQACNTPQDGVCHQGARTCRDGVMSACEALPALSTDRRACGPDCGECDLQVADACAAGACACGQGALCQGAERCCDGACLDTLTHLEHCGACSHACAEAVANLAADTAFCSDGACDYAGECAHGFLDCDGRRDNGCETPVGLEDCGQCGTDCLALVTHVPAAQKRCADQAGAFTCDYTGACAADFDDCDLERANGCEAWLQEPVHCGSCDQDCSGRETGELCLSPDAGDPYFHECGCRFDSATYTAEGCPAQGALCCARVCRDGASDGAHCGVCNAACTAGACQAGACACGLDGDCPAISAGTTCLAGACVCPHRAPGTSACPVGQFCCDGNQGGAGGPDKGPDQGCCPKLCGQNNTDADFTCTW